MAHGDVDTTFEADPSPLLGAIDKSKEAFESLSNKVALVAGLAEIAFAYVTNASANHIVAMKRLSDQYDMNIKTVQAFSIAIQEQGGSAEQAMGMIQRFEMRLGQAEMGSGRLGKAIRRMGLDLDTLKSEDAATALTDVLSHINEIQGGSERMAIARQLGLGPEAIRAFQEGGEAMEEYKKKAEEMGVAIDDQKATQVLQAKLAYQELHHSLEGLAQTITSAVAPTVKMLSKTLAELVQWFTRHQFVATFAASFAGLVAGAVSVAWTIQKVIKVTETLAAVTKLSAIANLFCMATAKAKATSEVGDALATTVDTVATNANTAAKYREAAANVAVQASNPAGWVMLAVAAVAALAVAWWNAAQATDDAADKAEGAREETERLQHAQDKAAKLHESEFNKFFAGNDSTQHMSSGGEMFDSMSDSAKHAQDEVDKAFDKAHEAYDKWSKLNDEWSALPLKGPSTATVDKAGAEVDAANKEYADALEVWKQVAETKAGAIAKAMGKMWEEGMMPETMKGRKAAATALTEGMFGSPMQQIKVQERARKQLDDLIANPRAIEKLEKEASEKAGHQVHFEAGRATREMHDAQLKQAGIAPEAASEIGKLNDTIRRNVEINKLGIITTDTMIREFYKLTSTFGVTESKADAYRHQMAAIAATDWTGHEKEHQQAIDATTAKFSGVKDAAKDYNRALDDIKKSHFDKATEAKAIAKIGEEYFHVKDAVLEYQKASDAINRSNMSSDEKAKANRAHVSSTFGIKEEGQDFLQRKKELETMLAGAPSLLDRAMQEARKKAFGEGSLTATDKDTEKWRRIDELQFAGAFGNKPGTGVGDMTGEQKAAMLEMGGYKEAAEMARGGKAGVMQFELASLELHREAMTAVGYRKEQVAIMNKLAKEAGASDVRSPSEVLNETSAHIREAFDAGIFGNGPQVAALRRKLEHQADEKWSQAMGLSGEGMKASRGGVPGELADALRNLTENRAELIAKFGTAGYGAEVKSKMDMFAPEKQRSVQLEGASATYDRIAKSAFSRSTQDPALRIQQRIHDVMVAQQKAQQEQIAYSKTSDQALQLLTKGITARVG